MQAARIEWNQTQRNKQGPPFKDDNIASITFREGLVWRNERIKTQAKYKPDTNGERVFGMRPIKNEGGFF